MEPLTNWAGNHTYGAARVHYPESREQLQELVAGSNRLKAIGARHSFSAVADTTGDLVSLKHFDRVIALDRIGHTVTVEAGIRYGALGAYVQREGYALRNLASLPHITVAGACATATHGSGNGNACLAAAVVALEMITADGEITTLSRDRDGDIFAGAVVALGALGIVTRMTLAVVPDFEVRQDVYLNLPLSTFESNFDAITGSGYSVSLFSDWRGPRFNQVWRKRRVDDSATARETAEPEFFGGILATEDQHPIPGMTAENCTVQRGIPGPWNERLPHFKSEFTPSSGDELQSEYLVPRHHARAALRVIDGLRDRIAPLLQVSEIRTIAADDLWLSPFYQQPCVALHFTWNNDWPAVRALLPLIEAQLAPLHARPHWGKLSTLTATDLRPLFPRLSDFQTLRQQYDPEGKFRNSYLDYLMG